MEVFVLDALALSRDAFLSQAWMYPLLGIYYLGSRPALYNAVAPVVIKTLITSLAITAGMFTFTYLPQLAFCAVFSGPLAFASAAVMVLGESYVLIAFVSKLFFLNAAQDRLCTSCSPSHALQGIHENIQSMPYLFNRATKLLSPDVGRLSRIQQVSRFWTSHS
jgi:hypothetical protein